MMQRGCGSGGLPLSLPSACAPTPTVLDLWIEWVRMASGSAMLGGATGSATAGTEDKKAHRQPCPAFFVSVLALLVCLGKFGGERGHCLDPCISDRPCALADSEPEADVVVRRAKSG